MFVRIIGFSVAITVTLKLLLVITLIKSEICWDFRIQIYNQILFYSYFDFKIYEIAVQDICISML